MSIFASPILSSLSSGLLALVCCDSPPLIKISAWSGNNNTRRRFLRSALQFPSSSPNRVSIRIHPSNTLHPSRNQVLPRKAIDQIHLHSRFSRGVPCVSRDPLSQISARSSVSLPPPLTPPPLSQPPCLPSLPSNSSVFEKKRHPDTQTRPDPVQFTANRCGASFKVWVFCRGMRVLRCGLFVPLVSQQLLPVLPPFMI